MTQASWFLTDCKICPFLHLIFLLFLVSRSTAFTEQVLLLEPIKNIPIQVCDYLKTLFCKVSTIYRPKTVPLKCNFTHARALACQHVYVNMLPITCDGVLACLTYCTQVLHEGLHTLMCYSSGYKLATRVYVLLTCMTVHVIHLHFTKHLYM